MLVSSSFAEALHSPAPAADRAGKLRLYGQFVGRWEMDAVYRLGDGPARYSCGEIHFGWVLEGRAIQDVWIVPARGMTRTDPPLPGDFYGTTLRIYDPGIDAWHILWSDPLTQTYRRMVGRARGPDIVQEGEDETGAPVRWSFTEVTADSFRWLAERSPDGGVSWGLLVEFQARRVAG